jgi:outer membrane lipoprotein-sorting protein
MRYALSILLFPALCSPVLAQDKDAEKLFRDVEKKIKAANAVEITFEIEVKKKKLKGSLFHTKDNKTQLKISGDLGQGDRKGTLELVSDGKLIKAARTPKVGGEKSSWPTPKNLHTLLGTMVGRAGVQVTLMALPHILGEQKEIDPESLRIEVYDFKAGPGGKVRERHAKVITYRLGQKADAPSQAAEVTLWIDAKTLLPLKRVVVQKKGKEGREGIRITETYSEITLNPKVDVKRFELPK